MHTCPSERDAHGGLHLRDVFKDAVKLKKKPTPPHPFPTATITLVPFPWDISMTLKECKDTLYTHVSNDNISGYTYGDAGCLDVLDLWFFPSVNFCFYIG